MKALTVKQPWASLICMPRLDNPQLGIKDIENRTWRTNYRGPVLIHASTPRKFKVDMNDECAKAAIPILKQAFDGVMPFGAIIGKVDIVDCVINHSSVWAEKMSGHTDPQTGLFILRKGQQYIWNWVLANPVLFPEPILNVKGKLSFWEYEGEIKL